MSAASERFRYSFFDDPASARDGLDMSSLEALEGDERGQAETMPLAFLPDSRAVIGLGALRSGKAEAQLVRLFEVERKQQIEARNNTAMQPGGPDQWHPSAMLYLAQALWRIHSDPRWPQAVTIRMMSKDAARRDAARREILAVIAGRTVAGQ